MKNIIKYFGSLLLIAGFVACSDLLEEVPLSQASPENSFKTEANARAAIVGVYSSLQLEGAYSRCQGLLTTDETNVAPKSFVGGINSYTFTADNIDVILPIWRDHYIGINRANLAIAKIPTIDMDVTERNSLVAEAKFIKSLLYFNLIRYFGDVPYKETETTSLNNLNIPRTPVATIYENIIKDLQYGVINLKVKAPELAGHATQDAAKTLLASVYLNRGSIAKRDNTGDKGIADFALAAKFAKEVMDANRYSLCDYFPDAFSVQNKNNNEIIFDVQFKSPKLGVGSSIGYNMGIPSDASGINNLLAGGSTATVRANTYHQFLYDKADSIRLQWTDARIEIKAATGKFIRLSTISSTPVSAGKFRRYPVHDSNFPLKVQDYDVNWPIFRFAEVLLIYAEALNETSGPEQEAIDALNKLRSRARNVNAGGVHTDALPRVLTLQKSTGLVDLTLSDPLVSTQEAFRDYIILERTRELMAEGKRWFDLVRWGKLQSTLLGLNAKFLAKQTQPIPAEVPAITPTKWKNYWNQQNLDWINLSGNVQDYHNLMPIPNNEILANPAIVNNNPGYN
ncbi:RagB/SusD family nutrient uptake outer membrane protein [Flavobacterium luteum]|uniref:RagB/SusD family nutrient uptake outer membrane protein n=1 Tax=Flavobacterium luteum TaxID=2026654 RepID=A0A7J5A8W6_9FLAO|nr:RagB/SusD family nutrient uptake outer membrane protein [Flavobacterium luteum]KAB1154014.1 RagB/SusD family nutrient uptake outer membrane protein [Flavobacterium luteum]